MIPSRIYNESSSLFYKSRGCYLIDSVDPMIAFESNVFSVPSVYSLSALISFCESPTIFSVNIPYFWLDVKPQFTSRRKWSKYREGI
jgi:hypothetical protein